MTGYRGSEDPSSLGRHERPAVSAPDGPAAGVAATIADSMTAQNGRGVRQLSAAKIWLTGLAGLLLILVGASVYSLVELSSVQASLSHAQQQISATRSGLSAEQQQVSADEQQLSTLESTVNSLPSDPLSAFTSMVCSNSDVYETSTGQTITAYYPCTDKNPG
jgi:hypothetical protein